MKLRRNRLPALLIGVFMVILTCIPEFAFGSAEDHDPWEGTATASIPFEERNLKNTPISWANNYNHSDGLAWAYYYNDTTGYTIPVVLDDQGNFLFELPGISGSFYPYDFAWNMSYYRVNENYTDYEVIVDREGNELFRTEPSGSDDHDQQHVIGRTEDGNFLLWVKHTGMEVNTQNIQIITPTGEVLSEYPAQWEGQWGTVEMERPEYGFSYIGEGWYYDYYNLAFNLETGRAMVMVSGSYEFAGGFSEGTIVELSHGGFGTTIVLRDRDMNELWLDVSFTLSSRDRVHNGVFYMQRESYNYDTGSVDYDHSFYDCLGNTVLTIPQHPSLDIWCSAIYDGYSVMELRGMDGNKYFTLINEAGEELFEPMIYEKILDYPMNGHVIADIGNGGYEVFDSNGNSVYKLYEDFTDADNMEWYQDGGEYLKCNYYMNGVEYMKVYRISEITALGNEGYDPGVMCYVEEYTEEDPEYQEELPESIVREYQYISDFVIEGKWKSIGSYGFGQAQPGAIVSFDGVHCNLFSPYDTYALYYNGEDYILETTSLLSTDTVSFRVKTIDNDHIDLVQGDYITELERIE